MLPRTTSIWQRDSQPNASGRPGAVHSSSGHLLDLTVPGPFADYLRKVMPEHVPVTAVDCHFNDEAFSDAITTAAREMLAAKA